MIEFLFKRRWLCYNWYDVISGLGMGFFPSVILSTWLMHQYD